MIEVDAASKREALRIGVPKLPKWTPECREDNRNPFAGVKAEIESCEHVGCWCGLCRPDPQPDGIPCLICCQPEGEE